MARIRRQDTAMRRAVPARERLMITLHWLATGVRFKDLADDWGVGKSTAHAVVHQVVPELLKSIVPTSIKFPTSRELRDVMTDFEALCKMPQCAGAIDGCFIKIVRPAGEFGHKYWCYKGMDAIILLAVVDARGIFTYCHCGTPGSVGDAGTYMDTALKRNCVNGVWLPESAAEVIQGVRVRPFIVADAAFPFSATLMKGYPGDPQPGSLEHAYNYAHVRTRRVVENAFGRLKGRFQVLRSSQMNDPAFHADCTLVCCALHNCCERHDDPFEAAWMPEDEEGEDEEEGPVCYNTETRAINIRDALARHVREAGGF
jgi:hypothetical protein